MRKSASVLFRLKYLHQKSNTSASLSTFAYQLHFSLHNNQWWSYLCFKTRSYHELSHFRSKLWGVKLKIACFKWKIFSINTQRCIWTYRSGNAGWDCRIANLANRAYLHYEGDARRLLRLFWRKRLAWESTCVLRWTILHCCCSPR